MLEELLRTALATGSVLASQVVCAVALLGVGLLVGRDVEAKGRLRDVPVIVWVGFGATIGFLIVWNFFLPIDGRTWLIVAPAAGVGLWRGRRRLAGAWGDTHAMSRPIIAAAGLFALWEANVSLGALVEWDSSLYHLQAVRWAGEYAAPAGLANLFGPLAYNNASFLFAALLDVGPWAGHAHHLANGLLALVLGLQSLIAIDALWRAREASAWAAFDALLIVVVVDEAVMANLPSHSTAFAAAVLVLASFSVAVRAETKDLAWPDALWAAAFTIPAAVAVKFSSALVVGLLFAWLMVRAARAGAAPARVIWASCTVAAVFGMAWVARSIVLSGYPVFPLPLGPVPVDWAAPLEHARAELAHIGYSEREFAWEIGPHWWRHVLDVPFRALVPLVVAAVCAVGWARAARRRASGGGAWPLIGLGLIATASLVAWIGSAPSTRYGVGLFWALAATWATAWVIVDPQRPRGLALGAALLVVLAGLQPLRPPHGVPGVERSAWRRLVSAHLNRADASGGPQSTPVEPRVSEYVTRSGLVVFVPVDRCWDAPLPCTPNPAPNLRLRREGRPGAGFVVVGEWQMEHFPQRWRPGWLDTWRRRDASRNER